MKLLGPSPEMLKSIQIQTSKKLFIGLLALFIQLMVNAQEEIVIDQKGTLVTINNNMVTVSAIAPVNPVEGDVWFDTTDPANRVTSVWDGTTWQEIIHEGTSGSLFYAGADGKPAEDNTQLFWDDTNNSLGIGTNSPTNKLEVAGAVRMQGNLNSNGTANEPSYRFSSDSNTGIFRPAADELGFTVGGIAALQIDETSNNTIVTINETLDLDGQILDENDLAGTAGQILSATATGTDWIDATTQNIYTLDGAISANRTVDGVGNSLDFTNIDGGYTIIGGTTGVGETAVNSSDGALLHLQQETVWSGLAPWALYVEGYSYLNGFRINGADGIRSIFTREAQLGFATQGNSPITFTQNTNATRLSILPDGILRFHEYGAGTITGTLTSLIGVESDGRVINVDASNFDTDASDDFSGAFGDLSGIPAGLSDGDDVDDADNNVTNEIQTLSVSGNDLSISGTGGNTVTLPAGGSISTDTGNSLSTGTDSGIFYESPIKAFAKIASNGTVVRATTGVSAARTSTGRYRVTLTAVVTDGNYIIQLTQPGRGGAGLIGGAGNDDPGISYANQDATGFDVIIGDNDNGGTDRARFNSEFMFTILDL